MTCKAVKVSKRKVNRCTSKLVNGPVTFTTTGKAKVSRAGKLYATATVHRADGKLTLVTSRPLTSGRYTLAYGGRSVSLRIR